MRLFTRVEIATWGEWFTIQKRVANTRKDFLHKHSTIIAKNHGLVGVEALPVRSMSASAKGPAAEPGRRVRQKAGVNRAILDQGWGPRHAGLGSRNQPEGRRMRLSGPSARQGGGGINQIYVAP